MAEDTQVTQKSQLKQAASTKRSYPDGAELKQQVSSRQRRGGLWQSLFVVATMVGIIALVALLYNIINSSFGYVAIQNRNDPTTVVTSYYDNKILNATNVAASENDAQLANRTASNPYAVAFFGYSNYHRKTKKLRVLTIDDALPSAESAQSGEYFLTRPLYFYASEESLREKPYLADFIRYYLDNVNSIISDVGYFAVSDELFEKSLAILDELSAAGGDTDNNSLQITGSSTVFPLSRELVSLYADTGASTEIGLSSIGSNAGIAQFCSSQQVDIVTTSRPMTRAERDACRQGRRTPVEFQIGTDAIAVVVSQKNDFVDSLSLEQLQSLFTTANLWSDLDPSWPAEPITRFVPSIDSSTLDFFSEHVFDTDMTTLPKDVLVSIIQQSPDISAAKYRQLDSELSFTERTNGDVMALVQERIVDPNIVDSWDLYDSLFNREQIELEASQIEGATLTFRNWLTPEFLSAPQSSTPEDAGIRTALFGSLWVILITLLFSLPLGVGAAIYLEEYAADSWFNRLIETNINNLAGVPSIIYGMLGLAIFVRTLEAFTSGAFFGAAVDPTTANGRTILSAGLTLGLLILPIIIINAREAIRAVPSSLRQASFGLGATRWQTIWNHVLPSALPGILTGNILAMSRAIGETAPLVVIGASTTIFRDPTGPFSKFTTLPIQIYQWTARPQAEFRHIAAAAIVVLLILLLTLNASAVVLRNRYSTKSA